MTAAVYASAVPQTVMTLKHHFWKFFDNRAKYHRFDGRQNEGGQQEQRRYYSIQTCTILKYHAVVVLLCNL